MCRTIQSVLQAIVCSTQMVIRIFMTFMLMMENLIRMLMQTFYNFCSFSMQILSLAPICLVFILSSRLKCFMCGGGGPCPVNRGGTCDCIMSGVAVVIIFLIFRATGVLDKIFYSMGYAKAQPIIYTRLLPTPGSITECSRNDTVITDTTTELSTITDFVYVSDYWYMTSSTVSSTPEPLIEWQTEPVGKDDDNFAADSGGVESAHGKQTTKPKGRAWREGEADERQEGVEREGATTGMDGTPTNVVYYLM